MEYKEIFKFNVDMNWKTWTMLLFLAIFPNMLGMLNITVFGLKIHFFQYLVFLAAIIYGPLGGAMSGAFGSLFTVVAMNNPYIMIGNMLLGFFAGLFAKKMHFILAVLLAYLIQMPYLWVTDVYLIGMPVKVVQGIIIALFISDMVWGFVAMKTAKKAKQLII